MAPWIIQHFPAHRVYVEAYGGAAGVLMRKPRAEGEVYNDLDAQVANFFKVLRDPVQRRHLVELVRYTPYSRAEFDEAFEASPDPVESARRLLIRAEMGFGSAGATKGATGFRCAVQRHTKNKRGRNVQALWAELPEHIETVARRFDGVLVENRPALTLIDYWDRPDVLLYLDPPYVQGTRNLGNRCRCYRHEMTDDDHAQMLDQIQNCKAMVVVSGYENSLYDDRLGHWERFDRTVAAAGKRGSITRTESLWLNPVATAKTSMAQVDLFEKCNKTLVAHASRCTA